MEQAQTPKPQFSVDIVPTGIHIGIPEGVQVMAGDVRNVLEAVRDLMVEYARLQIEEAALQKAEDAGSVQPTEAGPSDAQGG